MKLAAKIRQQQVEQGSVQRTIRDQSPLNRQGSMNVNPGLGAGSPGSMGPNMASNNLFGNSPAGAGPGNMFNNGANLFASPSNRTGAAGANSQSMMVAPGSASGGAPGSSAHVRFKFSDAPPDQQDEV